jgi:hypothetical protein
MGDGMTTFQPAHDPGSNPSSAGNHDAEEIKRLLRFFEIDQKTREAGRELFTLFDPPADEIFTKFYQKVQAFAINPHVTDAAIERLKAKQRAHWAALLTANFSPDYIQSIRRIGGQHREIALGSMWFVAGYAQLKIIFINLIAAAGFPPEKKDVLVIALEKYVAVDMALALSAYDSVLLD